MFRTTRLILSDLRAKAEWCYESREWPAVVKVLLTDGTLAMIWYRFMQAAQRWRLWPLAMVFNKINATFCQCVIGRGADFGPEFVLIHSQGVFINARVRGGTHILIEHQVTVGAEGRESPRLGNDIFIGAGAKITGGIAVGDGARIGANAVVIHDVPANATVACPPAVIVAIRPTHTNEAANEPA
jgi:serine O-acetyltransferase